MFCKLNAMQFVAFFILVDTTTVCLGVNWFSGIGNKLKENGNRYRTDSNGMKEVYKTHFLTQFKYARPFTAKKNPNFDDAAAEIKQKETHNLKLKNEINQIESDYQAFKSSGKNNGKLNMNEFLALKLYTGPDYEILNYFLRNEKMPEKNNLTKLGQDVLPKWTRGTVKEVVKDITSGLKKLQEEEHKKLYRGTTLDAEVISRGKKVTIGSLTRDDVFKVKGFVSTTTEWNEAAKIAQELSENFKSKPVILVLSKNAKNQGFFAAHIESLSKNQSEKERLILPGVEFQVVSTKNENVLVERKNKPSVTVTMRVIEVTRVTQKKKPWYSFF